MWSTGTIKWSTGDLFVLPQTDRAVSHACSASSEEHAALYWVSDEPLLKYLGVSPCEKRFEPTLFKRERMVETVEMLRHEDGIAHRNRLGKLTTAGRSFLGGWGGEEGGWAGRGSCLGRIKA